MTERIAQIAAETSSIRNLLSIGSADDQTFLREGAGGGERLAGRMKESQVLVLAELLADVYERRRESYILKEAMSTSDFPYLFGDVLYRQLLGAYNTVPVSYPGYFRIMDVTDFRTMKMYTIDGGGARLSQVAEYAPYPETTFTEGKYELSVAKYGRRYGISFEMLVNDDLNAFRSRPMVMATGARRSEEYLAASMLVDASGLHASYFTVGNANIITSNPPLSTAALQTAFTQLTNMVDSDGEPIIINGVNLIIAPGDKVLAENILQANTIRTTLAAYGGATGLELESNNWMKNAVQLHINPYLRTIATGLSTNPWFLEANPNDMTQRPAFMFGFLRGRRNPQLWVKDPNAQSLGGGSSSVAEGDFDTDSINYKLRHIFGAAQGDPKMCVGSDGKGS